VLSPLLLLEDDDDCAVLVVDARVVPLTEVLALEETPVLLLVFEMTLALELVTEDVDSDAV
jgi:hypothetical protein